MPRKPGSRTERTGQSRRHFLQRVGEIGGVGAVYQAMLALGLLVPGDASAVDSRQRWEANLSRLASSLQKPTVAILGAGIAGLVTAYELKKAGVPFFLLEARDRPGGRNLTVRAGSVITETHSQQTCGFDNDPELYFNAGPARISHHHTNILSYCRELGVSLEPFINDNRAAWMHSASAYGGRPLRAREVQATLRGAIAELLAKAINTGALDSEISFGERASVLAVLRDYGDLSANYLYSGSTRAGILPGSGGINPPIASEALDWHALFSDPELPYRASFSETYHQSATMLQPVGGMDRIAYALAEQVRESLYYNVEVTAIRRTANGVRIEGRTPEVEGAAEADYAVVALPPTVLKSIPNDFSSAVQSAIRSVRVTNPTKIAFQAPRFWETEEQIYGGISWTDPDILQIWYPSGGLGQPQGILIGSYLFGGSNATSFSNLSPAGRINAALSAGAVIHDRYQERLQHGISVAWSKVPYTIGGWATTTPSPLLQAPDGPFLFAGDHLTYLSGWQEGATISALHALATLTEVI